MKSETGSEKKLEKLSIKNFSKPLFSIITVVYNNSKHIEKTIKSVINQTYRNFEYIVIDGGSTDGTIDIIKKYEKNIDYWVSEPDKGIYDAMNKGIRRAKGDFVYFLDSGDNLDNDKNVLEIVSNTLNSVKDIFLVFGNIVFNYPPSKFFINSYFNNLKEGHGICHQACFVKTEFLKKNLFNLKYKSSSDFEMLCKIYEQGLKFKKINLIIAKVESGGFSSNKFITYNERYKIIRKYFNKYYAYKFYFKKICLEQGIKKLLLSFGLNRVYKKLLKLKMRSFK